MGGFGEHLEIENVILKDVLKISLCLQYFLCNKKRNMKLDGAKIYIIYMPVVFFLSPRPL